MLPEEWPKNKERILIVDDEEDILELVRYNLEREGYQTVCAVTGEQALQIAENDKVDLILLDLMLPGINGLEVAKSIKRNPHKMGIPIIMLSAKGEETDIVTGLELGADDYVTKPFSPKILLARIRAVIRKNSNPMVDTETVLHRHGISIHPGRRIIKINGKSVDLTYTEFQIIHYLAGRPGWVFTRTQIVDAVRGDNYSVTDRSVDVQMVGLRKKLGPYGKYLETVRGVGYRFRE
jgi:two-component system, OmpR family, alkaline phosphatase synthesis response regulator PhoP